MLGLTEQGPVSDVEAEDDASDKTLPIFAGEPASGIVIVLGRWIRRVR